VTPPRYAWQPTTAEIAQRFGLRPSDVVRFDQNTSPFPTDWAPSIVGPMAQRLNEYPGASYASLRQAAASYLDTDPDRIVPGAGIDEIILLIAKAFLGPTKRATAVVPTYPLYEIASLQHGAEFIAVEYGLPDFGFPSRPIGEAAETSDVTWLCSPNNPTGHRIADAEIAAIVGKASGLVVIDAAYAEFTRDRWSPWVERFDNVVVCQTLSKGFGLAALRVGFAMTNPEIARELDGVRPPGSISSMSAEIAESALMTTSRMHRQVDRIVRERGRLTEGLRDVGMYVVPDSEANFVLCHVGSSAGELAGDLLKEGLVVRAFASTSPIHEFLRFTVRTREENDRLIDALRRHRP
jgi:histidinol-phosphate aminotransferase